MCMSETTSADEAAGVASDASVEGAQETPTATTDPPANVPQNGRNGPGDMYLALKRMTHGVVNPVVSRSAASLSAPLESSVRCRSS